MQKKRPNLFLLVLRCYKTLGRCQKQFLQQFMSGARLTMALGYQYLEKIEVKNICLQEYGALSICGIIPKGDGDPGDVHLIVTFLNILMPVLGLLLTDEFDLFRQHQVSKFVKLKWCD
jgi:hypothetical protein